MNSIKYYDQNAEDFYNRTIHADVSSLYKKFLNYIKPSSKILDAGCSIGRDAKFFSTLGHNVTAFDDSIEMVKKLLRNSKKKI